MTKHDSPPQIRSLTGDSTIRHRETVLEHISIQAWYDRDSGEVKASFENPFFGVDGLDLYERVVADTPADALRRLADLIEEVAAD